MYLRPQRAVTGAAATAVWYLARDPGNKAVLRESGALPPLVELLKAGATRDACAKAAAALWSLADECPENKVAIAQVGQHSLQRSLSLLAAFHVILREHSA